MSLNHGSTGLKTNFFKSQKSGWGQSLKNFSVNMRDFSRPLGKTNDKNVNLYSTTEEFDRAKYFKKQMAAEIPGLFVIRDACKKETKLSTCRGIRLLVHAVCHRL